MINTGDRIKMFEDTDVSSYVRLVKDLGFDCHKKGDYLYVGERICETLRERIRHMRVAMYFERREIAEELGMPYKEYVAWEEGKAIPKGKYLRNFCQLANATEEYVLYGQGSWNPDGNDFENAWWKKS